uniref:Uncharacterized protein n=1 Tax=Physcomitrium patens TaxID=3218 RepID=A0A2K1JJP9_PHYPA|nr:hypothetical protein PHYPA_018919 [Physcomitrium patens]
MIFHQVASPSLLPYFNALSPYNCPPPVPVVAKLRSTEWVIDAGIDHLHGATVLLSCLSCSTKSDVKVLLSFRVGSYELTVCIDRPKFQTTLGSAAFHQSFAGFLLTNTKNSSHLNTVDRVLPN